ncbi:MAG: hypothetical protein P4L46_11520 [Fimbriimonas sp.]|nr:hypothetical protein [Fimbriimonas sp.]
MGIAQGVASFGGQGHTASVDALDESAVDQYCNAVVADTPKAAAFLACDAARLSAATVVNSAAGAAPDYENPLSECTKLFRGRMTSGSPQELKAHLEQWITWFKGLTQNGHLIDLAWVHQ